MVFKKHFIPSGGLFNEALRVVELVLPSGGYNRASFQYPPDRDPQRPDGETQFYFELRLI